MMEVQDGHLPKLALSALDYLHGAPGTKRTQKASNGRSRTRAVRVHGHPQTSGGTRAPDGSANPSALRRKLVQHLRSASFILPQEIGWVVPDWNLSR